MSASIPYFEYRLAQPGYCVYPGAHPGQALGSGQLFKRHEPLLASPDPRRIDLRASLLDPFQAYRVRVFQQHSQVTVYVVADLSASMAYRGKWRMLSDFIWSAAQSALRAGDSFGFIGCGSVREHRWLLPAGSTLTPVTALLRRLAAETPRGRAETLATVQPLLPSRRALVFFVSDCHYSLQHLQHILRPLLSHTVVPLVLWDEPDYAAWPDWGLVRLRDMEGDGSRLLWLRPGLKQRLIDALAERRNSLTQTFRSLGMEPLFMSGVYQAEQLSHYFQRHSL